ncbi:hypothetical protein OG352_03020 [Streptomyces sp. NBC_01485]|nr:hypothetical protein [Streptomyces sp. NBC_01485]
MTYPLPSPTSPLAEGRWTARLWGTLLVLCPAGTIASPGAHL